MLETKDWVTALSTTIMLSTLILLGLTVSETDTHYCESLNSTKYCDRLSTSGNRCYPTAGTTSGYKDCLTGWILIDRTEPQEVQNVKAYICSTTECIPKNL